MKKGKRRWWLIALIVVIVAAAAVTAALLLLDRNKTATVHYLTSTAAKGTIAETVQADFTLSNARDAMTISLSGTGSSSTSSSGGGSSLTSDSTVTTGGAITTVSAVATRNAATTIRAITYGAALGDGTPTPTPTPTATATPALTGFAPTSGPVGSTVTLTGTDLGGVSAVGFAGRAAFFKVANDTKVTAIVPAGAGSGPITVTSPDGTATSAARFTVTRSPRPTPTSTRSAGSSRSSGGTGSSFSSSRSSSTGTTSASTTASGSSASASGVVSGIVFAAGATPTTLQRLLSISGAPVYAFVSPTPLYATLSTSLASGAQRSNVAALQRALTAHGYYSGTLNGDFGASTETALKDWQADQGLSQTGQVTTSQFVWVPKGAVLESWSVALGGRVSSGTALATVYYPRDLVAQALVTQADVSSLKVGQKAALTIDGDTTDPFTATITSIGSQPASSSSSGGSTSTVDYTVDLAPHGLPSLAKSGMTGSLTVTIASRSNVLLVPTSAVSGSSSSTFVRVMINGVPTYRQVTTGMATSSLTQITSGLQAGEVVVTGQYTNSATSSTSTGSGLGGLGGLSGFPGGGFRRSTGGSSTGGSSVGGGGQ